MGTGKGCSQKVGRGKFDWGFLLFPQPQMQYYLFRVPEVLVEEKFYFYYFVLFL